MQKTSQEILSSSLEEIVVTHDSGRTFGVRLFGGPINPNQNPEINNKIPFLVEYNNMASKIDDHDDGWFEFSLTKDELQEIYENIGILLKQID